MIFPWHFKNAAAFFLMGGYAKTVWSAYGLTCLVLVMTFLHALKKERQLIASLKLFHLTTDAHHAQTT